MFLFPLNAGRNVSARFNVSTVPDADTLDPLPFRTHWLFCWLPLPGVMVPTGAVPASVNNESASCARLYVTEHPSANFSDALNKAETLVRSDAPLASANWKLNVCEAPLPEFGATPTTVSDWLKIIFVTNAP